MHTANDKLEYRMNNMMDVIHNHGVSKKELQQHATEFMDQMIDSGELEPLDALGKLTKIQDFLDIVEKKLREAAKDEIDTLAEKEYTVNGVTFSVRKGARRLNYKGDPECIELENKLSTRKELLKVASSSKDPIYDGDACEVPKVGFTESADSITVKY